MTNPLLASTGYADYAKISPDHIKPAVDELVKQVESKLIDLETARPQTWDELIPELETIEDLVSKVWSPVSHLINVKNSESLRKAYESAQSDIVKLGLRIEQSEEIYNCLKALKNGPEWKSYSKGQKRLLDIKLRRAKHSGIGLSQESKAEFNKIVDQIAKVQTEFMNAGVDSRNDFKLIIEDRKLLDGLSDDELESAVDAYNKHHADKKASVEAGPWMLTLDQSFYTSFMKNAKNRELRKQLYKGNIQVASHGEYNNSPRIIEILKLKQRLAQILGYKNYAEFSMAEKMAAKTRNARSLIEQVKNQAKKLALQEEKDLNAFAKAKGAELPLEYWDVGYWSERMKEELFEFNDEILKAYFPLDSVLDGLFDLVEKLFKVRVVNSSGEVAVWDPEVRFYKVYDEHNQHLASFYMDPFSRPGEKRSGAWLDTMVSRMRLKSGDVQLPLAVIVCNSAAPVGDKPALLTFREVETVFHEFGHALQHMLTTVDNYTISGIEGIEWDAVELPSQFMENFLYQKSTMDKVSGHYKSGEALPDDLFEKLKKARNYRKGWFYLRQLTFGLIDLELFENFDPSNASPDDAHEQYRQIFNQVNVTAVDPDDRFLCGFGHIFAGGYSAGYYSYLWADVLSADAFGAFEEAGLDNPDKVAEVGMKFRNTVLAKGGSEHPSEVYKQFRGRDPNTDALMRHNGLSA